MKGEGSHALGDGDKDGYTCNCNFGDICHVHNQDQLSHLVLPNLDILRDLLCINSSRAIKVTTQTHLSNRLLATIKTSQARLLNKQYGKSRVLWLQPMFLASRALTFESSQNVSHFKAIRIKSTSTF